MEHIHTPKVENVKLLDKFSPKNSPLGTLYLTTTHLIFVSNNPEAPSSSSSSSADASNVAGSKKELWILHMLIHTVERPVLTTSGTQIKIFCSHFQSATFIVQKDRDAHNVYLSLVALSKPKEIQELYCFSYNPKGELRQTTGWHFHDIQAEFQRQGVPNENWSHCTMNYDYSLCPTYSKHIYVPCLASQSLITGSAEFRSKRRLPVLSYLHKNNAAIVRCAQPMVGIGGGRSAYDEKYVECLRRATPGAPFIHIIDTRPAINAMANRAGGKGYESDKYYENIQFSFRGIENIHKMRSSLKAMMQTVSSSTAMDVFMSDLASSGWLKHVKACLESSVAIMSCVLEGRSVIVHCSDGWDRTAQTCALAGLMLDGYYRTLQGFQALIEKEWLSFGHKFADRCGHIEGDPNEVSPVFAQFLDATWQLTQSHPQFFQFNERYLIAIHEHAYSCQYGTFVGNCEREREELRLGERTYSLWGFLVTNNDEYVNPLYDRATSGEILRPNTAPQNIRFWSGLYCRFENGAHPREPLIDLLAITQNHTSSLEDHGRQISKTIGQVTQMIANAATAATGAGGSGGGGGGGGGGAGGAVRRMLSSSQSQPQTPPQQQQQQQQQEVPQQSPAKKDSELEKMEKKFTDLKTTIVEKCQSSKNF